MAINSLYFAQSLNHLQNKTTGQRLPSVVQFIARVRTRDGPDNQCGAGATHLRPVHRSILALLPQVSVKGPHIWPKV